MSKDKALLNDVVFYYQLKYISVNGFFAKGTISSLQYSLPYKNASIWLKISRLCDNNLMIKCTNGYRLVSYDKLFEILGYNLSYQNNRKGKFKINRIPIVLNEIKYVKLLIAYTDIRDNLKYQTTNAVKNLNSSNLYAGTKLHCTNDKKHLLNQIVNKNTVQMVCSNDNNKQHMQLLDAFGKSSIKKHFNPDITLSLKGICNTLGLPNTSSANDLIKRMQNLKWLTTHRRIVPLHSTTLNYKEVKKQYGDSYNIENGMIVRVISNKIICLK